MDTFDWYEATLSCANCGNQQTIKKKCGELLNDITLQKCPNCGCETATEHKHVKQNEHKVHF